ncbi:MAG: DNA-directed DNA polymerase II small subunit [Candidatus Micrarchaeia archaeon]
MLVEKVIEKGIRISVEVEEILKKSPYDDKLLEEILKTGKKYLQKEDIEKIMENKERILEKRVVIQKTSLFRPIAKEYSPDMEILGGDITGNSRTTGGVEDFIEYFRNRYKKLSAMLRKIDSKYPEIEIRNLKKCIGQNVKIIGMVANKKETKKNNILVEMEDLTGIFKVVISKQNERLFELSEKLILDDVVAIRGKALDGLLIADDIEWPDMRVTREKKIAERDLAIAYLSDIHFGSNNFLAEYFEKFISWIKGENGAEALASKLKYIIIAGDIVDGIGIYPNQEKELLVTDIYKQYKLFDDFVSRLPDYIEVIAIPGNHDAVRRGEPTPALEKDLISADITSLGNPSNIKIEGLKHLIYHGTSMDSMISAISSLSYKAPEKVMEELLKRRHLSPIYGGNQIVPEKTDYLVLSEEPDIFHTGHIHKNGYGQYRGTLMVNSGTFQARTEFQIKQGHMPTPAIVPVYELKTARLKTLNFASGG